MANLKLCCVLNGEPVGIWALRSEARIANPCLCKFQMCDRCTIKVTRGLKEGVPSKLWPKGNTKNHVNGYLALIDCHYFNDPECPWVKAFIKQEGEPNLNG